MEQRPFPGFGGSQADKPQRKLQPIATPCQRRVLAGAAAWSPHRSRFSGRTCDPWGTLARAVCFSRSASHDEDPSWSRGRA